MQPTLEKKRNTPKWVLRFCAFISELSADLQENELTLCLMDSVFVGKLQSSYRLLSKMKESGLLLVEGRTWKITEIGLTKLRL